MKNDMMIEIQNLHKSFYHGKTPTPILTEINLSIAKGECIVLKGVSGSGKTTLLSLIAGLDKPNQGKILIDKEPISKLPDAFASTLRAKKIGMIFQHFNLLEHLNVYENVSLPLIPSGMNMHEIDTHVNTALTLANISHKKESLSSRLSGGEKQRTAIARALVANPDIILCDEPTANLDKENSLLFIKMLETLHQMDKTIVVATHDPLFDTLFASRLVPMQEGRIVS